VQSAHPTPHTVQESVVNVDYTDSSRAALHAHVIKRPNNHQSPCAVIVLTRGPKSLNRFSIVASVTCGSAVKRSVCDSIVREESKQQI
jgi:hypothetical protein